MTSIDLTKVPVGGLLAMTEAWIRRSIGDEPESHITEVIVERGGPAGDRLVVLWELQSWSPVDHTNGLFLTAWSLATGECTEYRVVRQSERKRCDVCGEPLQGDVAEVVRNEDVEQGTDKHLLVHAEPCFDRERMVMA
jgi:hypothetical protein